MAYIDKIYFNTYKEFKEYWDWCERVNELCVKDTSQSLFDGLYYTLEDVEKYISKKGYYPHGFILSNYTQSVDKWLILHCPIVFIRNRLREQYGDKYIDKIPKSKIELYL